MEAPSSQDFEEFKRRADLAFKQWASLRQKMDEYKAAVAEASQYLKTAAKWEGATPGRPYRLPPPKI